VNINERGQKRSAKARARDCGKITQKNYMLPGIVERAGESHTLILERVRDAPTKTETITNGRSRPQPKKEEREKGANTGVEKRVTRNPQASSP